VLAHLYRCFSTVVVSAIFSVTATAAVDSIDIYAATAKGLNRAHQGELATEEVDPFGGALQLSYVDGVIPGNGGLDIKIQRHYRSYTSFNNPAQSPEGVFVAMNQVVQPYLGRGWIMHYGKVYTNVANNSFGCNMSTDAIGAGLTLETPDGVRRTFHRNKTLSINNPMFITADRWKATCSSLGESLSVVSPDGTEYLMGQNFIEYGVGGADCTVVQCRRVYLTTQIRDRNSNAIDVLYNVSTSISTGNDVSIAALIGRRMGDVSVYGDGRRAVFSSVYAPSGILTSTINLIYRDANGTETRRTITYGTTGNNTPGYSELKAVLPTGREWRYLTKLSTTIDIPDANAITRITHPEGGTVNIGYQWVDSGPSINSLRRSAVASITKNNGVDSQTLNYAYDFNNDRDQTTVTFPSGKKVFQYWGYRAAYYQTAVAGRIARLGALLRKETYLSASTVPHQIEQYTWGLQALANENVYYPMTSWLVENTANALLLQNRTIQTQDGAGSTAYRSFTTAFSNFDAYGNAQTISETGTHSRVRRLTYLNDATKWLVKQVKSEAIDLWGTVLDRGFDTNGNMTYETKLGTRTDFTYNPLGGVVTGDVYERKQTARGTTFTHIFRSYLAGVAQYESHPEGVAISRVVDGFGNTRQEQNPETGQYTSYTYDDLNRLKTASFPTEPVAGKTKNPVTVDWQLTSRTVTKGNLRESASYNGFGAPTSRTQTDAATLYAVTNQVKYNAIGQKVFDSYPNSNAGTTNTYDALERTTRVTHPDGTFRLIEDYGSVVYVTNERGYKTTMLYRVFGDPSSRELLQIVPPEAAATVTIDRDLVGLVKFVTQSNITRGYTYFPGTNFLKSVTDPERGTVDYVRDEIGNLTSQTLNGVNSTFGYDSLHRMKRINNPAGTPSVDFAYFKDGKLQTVSNGLTTRAYTYDLTRDLVSESVGIDGYTFSAGYDYDNNGRLQNITYPVSGKTIAYNPDGLGRPKSVGSYVTNVTYWDSGQIRRLSYANGVTSELGQDARLRPSTIAIGNAASPFVASTYGYDAVGNVKQVSDSIDAIFNRTFDYDPIDRVTTSNGPWGSGFISYDGLGNIKSQTLGTFGLAYNYNPTNNRLDSITGSKAYAFGYDLLGNVSSNGTGTFQYDASPNMVCANCNTANAINYTYDGKNQRVKSVKGGLATYEFYSSLGNLMMEYTPNTPTQPTIKELIYLGNRLVATRKDGPTYVSTITLTTIPNPPVAGKPITLRATVSGDGPTGRVTFWSNGVIIGYADIINGVAEFVITNPTPGSYSYSASYAGDGDNRTSVLAQPVVVWVINLSAITAILQMLLSE
jgi:YD repeat-containing protein